MAEIERQLVSDSRKVLPALGVSVYEGHFTESGGSVHFRTEMKSPATDGGSDA
jgi:hypothetical protein